MWSWEGLSIIQLVTKLAFLVIGEKIVYLPVLLIGINLDKLKF